MHGGQVGARVVKSAGGRDVDRLLKRTAAFNCWSLSRKGALKCTNGGEALWTSCWIQSIKLPSVSSRAPKQSRLSPFILWHCSKRKWQPSLSRTFWFCFPFSKVRVYFFWGACVRNCTWKQPDTQTSHSIKPKEFVFSTLPKKRRENPKMRLLITECQIQEQPIWDAKLQIGLHECKWIHNGAEERGKGTREWPSLTVFHSPISCFPCLLTW